MVFWFQSRRVHLLHLFAVPEVTPANVSGGGGSKSELVITWEVSGVQTERQINTVLIWMLPFTPESSKASVDFKRFAVKKAQIV